MKIYISGPMTGVPEDEYKLEFSEVENELIYRGHIVFNPARLAMTGFRYEEYMAIDFAAIEICDAIFLMKGWRKSPGAVREYLFAGAHNKKIYERIDDIDGPQITPPAPSFAGSHKAQAEEGNGSSSGRTTESGYKGSPDRAYETIG